MLIPLSSLEHNHPSSHSRRRNNNITSRLTKIIVIHKKRAALLAIGILGIIHYFRFTAYNNQHNKKELFDDKFAGESSSSYLYPPHEALPYVIDYNPNNNDDYQTLNTPKVIEFCKSLKVLLVFSLRSNTHNTLRFRWLWQTNRCSHCCSWVKPSCTSSYRWTRCGSILTRSMG